MQCLCLVCYPDLHSDETEDTGIQMEGVVTEVTLSAVLEGIDSSLSLSYSGFNPDLQSTMLSWEDPSSEDLSSGGLPISMYSIAEGIYSYTIHYILILGSIQI